MKIILTETDRAHMVQKLLKCLQWILVSFF